MRRFIILASLMFSVTVSLAQENTDFRELEMFFEKLALSVDEGNFETYKSLFHVDAIGVVVTSESEKRTAVIAETLKQNKIDMLEVSSGRRQQKLQFKFDSIFQDSSSALVSGMIHFWSSEQDPEQGGWFGYFEMYLLKKQDWMIVANQQGRSTREEWEELD